MCAEQLINIKILLTMQFVAIFYAVLLTMRFVAIFYAVLLTMWFVAIFYAVLLTMRFNNFLEDALFSTLNYAIYLKIEPKECCFYS